VNPEYNNWDPTPHTLPPAAPPPPPKKHVGLFIGLGVATIALVVVALGLTFGGGDPGKPPAATATTSSATATQSMSVADQDALFYRWVNRHPWSRDGNTEEDWTGLASSMCGAMDRGAQYDDVAGILQEDMSDMNQYDRRDFVEKAVQVYCPEHIDRVPKG